MSNTISATLMTAKLNESAIPTIQSRLAPVRAFATSFTADRLKPKAKVEFGVCTAVPAALTDATSWETGRDSTLTAGELTNYQISQPFHISNADTQNGITLDQLFRKNAQTFADAVWDLILTPLTTANYGAATWTGTAVQFGAAEVATLLAAIKNGSRRSLVLETSYFSRALPAGSSGQVPGFDFVGEASRWNGAGSGVVGFANAPEALAVASGLPIEPPDRSSGLPLITTSTSTIPGIGLPMAVYQWADPRFRRVFVSFEIVISSQVADSAALKLITSS